MEEYQEHSEDVNHFCRFTPTHRRMCLSSSLPEWMPYTQSHSKRIPDVLHSRLWPWTFSEKDHVDMHSHTSCNSTASGWIEWCIFIVTRTCMRAACPLTHTWNMCAVVSIVGWIDLTIMYHNTIIRRTRVYILCAWIRVLVKQHTTLQRHYTKLCIRTTASSRGTDLTSSIVCGTLLWCSWDCTRGVMNRANTRHVEKYILLGKYTKWISFSLVLGKVSCLSIYFFNYIWSNIFCNLAWLKCYILDK